MDTGRLLDEVLTEITPTPAERKKEGDMADEVLSWVSAVLNARGAKAGPVMVGSIAKGTDLREDKDFDVFIRFSRETPRDALEATGLAVGKEFFRRAGSKAEISYAEHPYVKGTFKGFRVEIVPCYMMEKGARVASAVDRSPLHTEFVLSELSKKPSLRGDIRLLKKFMKCQGLYGAHAAVEGFSGYLCELLVIKYGSFLGVLKAAALWANGQHIGIGASAGAKKFPDDPLVFIDPVDGRRNVAAAVSVSKMAGFMRAASEFLARPSKSFFRAPERRPLGKKEFYGKIRNRGTELLCVRFAPPDMVEDTLIPQLAKSLKALRHECEHAGFRVLKDGYWTDGKEAAFVLEFEVWELPRVMKKMGPYFDSKAADLNGFIASNRAIAVSKPYLESGQWAMDAERKHRRADACVKALLKDPKGFGKNLRSVKAELLIGSGLLKIKSRDFWGFMGAFW